MPGIIYHLAFAEEVYRHLKNKVNKVEFFSGNLIPDLVVPENKKASHYRVPASVNGFVVPDMKAVRKDLYDANHSIKLGMFCHLYLDYHFFESYLIPEFIWDANTMQVINPRNGLSWPAERFFAKASDGGILYAGYTQINHLMLFDGHISQETLNLIPDHLPLTGLPVFDKRREKTWREELNGYLSENLSYTGEILDYERLWSAISSFADKFINEEIPNIGGAINDEH